MVMKAAERFGLHLRRHCIWYFRFGVNQNSNFASSHSHLLYYVIDQNSYTWCPDEIMEPSDRALVYKDKRTYQKDEEAKHGLRLPLDVWEFSRIQGNNKERRHEHPNQIPEEILFRIIRCCSKPGDLVLDPFLGSGGTSVVARFLDRSSVGIEIGKKTAASAVERIMKGPVRTPPVWTAELLQQEIEKKANKK
jgi:site-specific DNA-methyltransferase (adenine-specific)